MKVRLKREIVTMGQPDIDPENSVGTYVTAGLERADKRTDTLVIDTRNRYEVAIGTFENAVDPETASFRDFPAWIENYMADLPEKSARKISPCFVPAVSAAKKPPPICARAAMKMCFISKAVF